MCARSSALALSLCVTSLACVPTAPERTIAHPPTLATLRLRLPAGAIATYSVVIDEWLIASSTDRAILSAAPAGSIASPDAFRHAFEVEHRGVKVDIEARESLSDGFSITLVEHAASDRSAWPRTTYVVRELGNQWVQCVGSAALCKSLKRG